MESEYAVLHGHGWGSTHLSGASDSWRRTQWQDRRLQSRRQQASLKEVMEIEVSAPYSLAQGFSLHARAKPCYK